MVLRQRLKKLVSLKTVKVLDAFPKVGDACRETSPIGGTLSIIAYILMGLLTVSEITFFLHSKITYKFVPDIDFDKQVNIYIDITVAMPCAKVGADVLDTTHQNMVHFGELKEEDTWFDLEPAQRLQFENIRNVNAHLRRDYHQLHEYLWRSASPSFINKFVPRKEIPDRRPDACRIHGDLYLNKVAGNLHMSAGKPLQLPRGHIHISPFMSDNDFNFSHRINHFSFGDFSPGIVHPLEGDEKIASEGMMSYQYFIEIVPTEVKTFLWNQLTYQYSVKDHQRPINHHLGSHGVPGISFKYDMSALKVIVVQERDSPLQFIVRLCASVGGIHVTTGLISFLIRFIVDYYNYRYSKKKSKFSDSSQSLVVM